jgi:hypothetical protein
MRTAAVLALLVACVAAQQPTRPVAPVVVRHVDPAQWSAGVAAAAIVAANALDRDVRELALPDGVSDDPAAAGATAARIVAATTGTTVAPAPGTIYPDGSTGPAPVGELAGMALPAPLAEADLALDAATAQTLEARYREWQQKVATEWATLIQLDSAGRLPKLLGMLRDAARMRADEAEKLHHQGHLAAAYSRMLAAWAYATSSTRTYAVLSKVQAGDLAGADELVSALGAGTVGDVLHRIGLAQPATLAGHVAMLAAFRSTLEAMVFDQLAARAIASSRELLDALKTRSGADLGSPATADQVVDTIAPAIVDAARRDAGCALAEQELALEPDAGPPRTVSLAEVRRMADAYRSAAAAMLPAGTPTELETLVASVMVHLADAEGLPQQLRAEWGEDSRPWALLSLAAGELAYLDAATRLARSTLGVHTDAQGHVDAVAHEDALAPLLAAADRHARASARAAGTIPVQIRLAYQLATIEKTGSLDDRLDALSELWAAFVTARVTSRLAH